MTNIGKKFGSQLKLVKFGASGKITAAAKRSMSTKRTHFQTRRVVCFACFFKAAYFFNVFINSNTSPVVGGQVAVATLFIPFVLTPSKRGCRF
jgi:hypothetical protein